MGGKPPCDDKPNRLGKRLQSATVVSSTLTVVSEEILMRVPGGDSAQVRSSRSVRISTKTIGG